MRHKYTNEDIYFLKEHYPIGDWESIELKFPDVSRSGIHKKCHKLGIKFDMQYKKKSTNANRIYWNEQETAVLIKNYDKIPLKELEVLLPKRNRNSIISKAQDLNIMSFNTIQQKWRDKDIQYIKDNWILVPDKIMANMLGRTFRSVKAKREELGLYRRNMDSLSYPTLSKYLRGNNQKWKLDSMKSCNYQCVLTTSKNFEIHHLYGLSNIISDILNVYKKYKDKAFSDLSDDDLSFILQEFILEQSKYPLGECVETSVHTLFHSMYGQYYNTPEQWYQFKTDYNNGLYKQYA